MSDKIIYVGNDPFGSRSLRTPSWVSELGDAHWEDAPNAQDVYVHHA